MERYLLISGIVFFVSAAVGTLTPYYPRIIKIYWSISSVLVLLVVLRMLGSAGAEFAFFLIFAVAFGGWFLVSTIGLGIGRILGSIIHSHRSD